MYGLMLPAGGGSGGIVGQYSYIVEVFSNVFLKVVYFLRRFYVQVQYQKGKDSHVFLI